MMPRLDIRQIDAAQQLSAAELRARFVSLVDMLSALRGLLALQDTLTSEAHLAQAALSQLVVHQHLDYCSVFLRDGNELRCLAGTGFDEAVSEILGRPLVQRADPDSAHRFRVGEGVMGLACSTGRLQRVAQCLDDWRFKTFEDPGAGQPIGSLLAVPLRDQGQVFGVLNASHPETGFFDAWHEHALSLFAAALAQLLAWHRLRSNLDQRVAARTDALEHALQEADRLRQRFEHLSTVDELTGLHNRRHFFSEAPREVANAQRDGSPLTLVVVDIDHFKRVNDTWGHDTGDKLLQQVAGALETTLRGGDLCARLGGEEFILLLSNTEPSGAVQLVERIRARLPALPQVIPGGPRRLTASFGIVALHPGMARLPPGDVLDLLYAQADKALYQCKAAGRNRWAVFQPNPE